MRGWSAALALVASCGLMGREIASASDGSRWLVLRSAAVQQRELQIAAPSRVVVHAQRNRCAGARRLRVAFDGERARTLRLRRGIRSYTLARRLGAGSHTVRLALAHARIAHCRPRVRIDSPRVVALHPARTVPVPAPLRRVPLGTALAWDHVQGDAAYAAAALGTFASFTPENELKMERLEPAPNEYDFATADALVDFALANGKQVRGHALVFGAQTPAWMGHFAFEQDVDGAMSDYIAKVLAHFRGRIGEWDVVNEALDRDGNFRHNVFFDRMGPTYVDKAFRYARADDPSLELFYNEYDAERPGPKRDATLALVRRLHDEGVIDGVGLQLHTTVDTAPTQAQIEDTMRLYEAMGLKVQVTEMDASIEDTTTPLDQRLAAQAEVFRAAATACADVPACERFSVWGVTDRYSWRGEKALPLLLDGDYRPKPALGAVRAVIGA